MLDEQAAIAGAMDILAENISDEAGYRSYIRERTMKKGKLISQAKEEGAESVYEMYYDFEEPLTKLAGHRILALNRGEKEKFLTVKVEAPEEDILRYLNKKVIRKENPYTTPVLRAVCEDSYKRLIAPAIEREIRSDLTEKAEDGAIPGVRKESGTAAHAAAHYGPGGVGMGSCFSYRMQAGSSRFHGKSAGYGGNLPYRASEQGERSKGSPEKTDFQISYYSDFCRKRNRFQGVGTGYCGTAEGNSGSGSVCDC